MWWPWSGGQKLASSHTKQILKTVASLSCKAPTQSHQAVFIIMNLNEHVDYVKMELGNPFTFIKHFKIGEKGM